MSKFEEKNTKVLGSCANLIRFAWRIYKKIKDKKLAALKAAEEEKKRIAAAKKAKDAKGKKGKKAKKKAKKVAKK